MQLYRGYPSNLFNMASCTMWQFAVAGAIQKVGRKSNIFFCTCRCPILSTYEPARYLTQVMLGGERREVTPAEYLISGLGAGMSSGIVGGPAELMMIQQQIKGGNMLQRAKEIGPRVLRGLFPTAMREGTRAFVIAMTHFDHRNACMFGIPKDHVKK